MTFTYPYEASCVHEQRVYMSSMSMVNESTLFVLSVGHATWFKAYWASFLTTSIDLLYLRVAQVPKSQNLAVDDNDKNDDDTNWFLNLLCIHAG